MAEADEIAVKGFVRVGDDTDSDLRVTLMVIDEQLLLMSNLIEIGAWPLSTVDIVRAHPDRFDLTIGDESIGFFPDAPDEFAVLPVVPAQSRKKRRKARRRRRAASKATTDSAAAEPISPSHEPPEPRRKRLRRQRSRSRWRKVHEARRQRRKIRDEKRQARKAAKHADPSGKAAPSREAAQPRSRPRRTRRSRVGPFVSATTRRIAEKARPRLIRARWRVRLAWYWVLDELREFDDGFPWNHIPEISDEKRKEPGHVHSFDARRGPAGIIRHVCRCGKMRLESLPIQLEGPAHLRSPSSDDTTPD